MNLLVPFQKRVFWPFVHSLIDWEREVEYGGCFGKDWVSVACGSSTSITTPRGAACWHSHPSGSAGLSTIDMVNLCAAGSVKHVLLEKKKISQYVFSNENGESGAPGLVLARASAKAAKVCQGRSLDEIPEEQKLAIFGIERVGVEWL